MKIIGTGSAHPSCSVSNEMLEKFLETTDEWITERTGIKERCVISSEKLEDLATIAANKALEDAGLTAKDIDFIICSNVVNEYVTPALSCIIQGKIGATCPTVDINAACAGFIFALDMAEDKLNCKKAKNILIVCAEEPSRMVSWKNRSTCVLFGDGAGAVLLEPTTEEFGWLDSHLRTDGHGLPFLHMKAGGSVCPPSHFTVANRMHYVHQEGRTVFKFAVTNMSDSCALIADRNGLNKENIAWVLPHQANLRIIDAVANRLEVPMEKVMLNIQRYGNTSAGTLPLALWDYESQLNKGDNLILTAFGAGFTWGAAYLKWGY